jgi:hypothetical protein
MRSLPARVLANKRLGEQAQGDRDQRSGRVARSSRMSAETENLAPASERRSTGRRAAKVGLREPPRY